jgi:hypothetical protein
MSELLATDGTDFRGQRILGAFKSSWLPYFSVLTYKEVQRIALDGVVSKHAAIQNQRFRFLIRSSAQRYLFTFLFQTEYRLTYRILITHALALTVLEWAGINHAFDSIRYPAFGHTVH